MLKSPGPVQKQLSQAIAIIGQQDFPMNWQNLVTDLVAKFATGDFHVINGVLQTAHSIFEKYAIEFKSQKLWEEIKFVLDRYKRTFFGNRNIFLFQICGATDRVVRSNDQSCPAACGQQGRSEGVAT